MDNLFNLSEPPFLRLHNKNDIISHTNLLWRLNSPSYVHNDVNFTSYVHND